MHRGLPERGKQGMLASVARIATEHREARLPKEERQQKEREPYHRGGPILGHGKLLQIQIERLRGDSEASKHRPQPTAARKRLMGLSGLRVTT